MATKRLGMLGVLVCAACCTPAWAAATGATILAAPTGITVGGGGAEPIPSYTVNQQGGFAPLTVIFDPRSTYLPESTNPAVTYLYQAVWTFDTDITATNEDVTFLVPAAPSANPAACLAQLQVLFNVDPNLPATEVPGPFQPVIGKVGEQKVRVNFRINITLQSAGVPNAPGPSKSIEGEVHMSAVNYAPSPVLEMLSSPPTGIVPYELAVTTSQSFDTDGFLVYAVIAWGDGVIEPITLPLPQIPVQTLTHTYTQPGLYKVELFVIDNGRTPPGTTFTGLSLNPYEALTTIATSIAALPEFNPQLRSQALLVQIPGSVTVLKGGFQVNFAKPGNDKFDVTFQPNIDVDSVSNATVTTTVGTRGFPNFVTDNRGRFKAEGFSFDFNAKRRVMRLKIDKQTLTDALALPNASVVNGFNDVPVQILINGTTALGTTVRFVYNAKKDGKGRGTDARAFPAGN